MDSQRPYPCVRLVCVGTDRLVDVSIDGPCMSLLSIVWISKLIELALDLHAVLESWLRLLCLQRVDDRLHLLVVELLLAFIELVLELHRGSLDVLHLLP